MPSFGCAVHLMVEVWCGFMSFSVFVFVCVGGGGGGVIG